MQCRRKTGEFTGIQTLAPPLSTRRGSMRHGLRRLLGRFLPLLVLAGTSGGVVCGLVAPARLEAQAAAHQLGTVTSVTGSVVVLKSAAGVVVTVTADPAATVLQLPAGSKNLKDATPATLADVAVGDRVLATGSADAGAGTLTASRVIVMKASDIASLKESQRADWRRNGVSGLVRGVEGPVLTISASQHTMKVETTATTVFRRYAAGSVNFSAAVPGSLAEIQVGDQISVRGSKSGDGGEITADEIVSGTFQHLSGAIAAIDTQAQTLTLKDLVTKKSVTVQITPKSDLRRLPAETGRAFAERNQPLSKAAPAARDATQDGKSDAVRTQRAGMDLSRLLPRLPEEKLSDLKVGDAVLIVASAGGSSTLTAITMLSGVEQLLSAKGAGSQPITLSPWTLGAPDTGAP